LVDMDLINRSQVSTIGFLHEKIRPCSYPKGNSIFL
jgi:hypothetical protein